MAGRATAYVLLMLVAGGAALLLFSGGSGPSVQAEFTNARGLLVGNDVRMGGAPAGSVEDIELTVRNTAMVTLRLDEGVPALHPDAVAAIRPTDLLGDVYLALSPGTEQGRLTGVIPTTRTSNAPRLADLLSAFRAPVRDGLEALFVEGGLALDQRGIDVNRAAIDLRPTLEAADGVMLELGSQNAALRALVEDSSRLSRQVAGRDTDLGLTVDALAATVRATAARAPELDAGLRSLPDLLARLRTTAGHLRSVAGAAVPLAVELRAAAPPLARAAGSLPGFLGDAGQTAQAARPLVRELEAVLVRGEPTFDRLANGARALREAAPGVNSLLEVLVPAAAPISEGFFVNFADQAAEPGTQPFDPFADPRRNYWRGAAVMTCEAFGMKIAPGCLDGFLNRRATSREGTTRRRTPRRQPSSATPQPEPAPVSTPGSPAPALPAEPLAPVKPLIDALPDAPLRPGDAPAILDFLFGP